MANAKKCDRCGKFYETSNRYPRFEIKRNEGVGFSFLDLCWDCQEKLYDFIDETGDSFLNKEEVEKKEFEDTVQRIVGSETFELLKFERDVRSIQYVGYFRINDDNKSVGPFRIVYDSTNDTFRALINYDQGNTLYNRIEFTMSDDLDTALRNELDTYYGSKSLTE